MTTGLLLLFKGLKHGHDALCCLCSSIPTAHGGEHIHHAHRKGREVAAPFCKLRHGPEGCGGLQLWQWSFLHRLGSRHGGTFDSGKAAIVPGNSH